MTQAGRGIFMAICACMIWGFSPLFYKMLDQVPPLDVLAHRTLWSLMFLTIILAIQGRLRQVLALFSTRETVMLTTAAAVMISINWGLFIFAIQIGRAVDASIGYFIFPLVAVFLGRLVYKEPMTPGKIVAVTLALIAVLSLSWGIGAAPWISLVLAGSFGIYSMIKKRVDAGPVVSVTAEVLIVAPLAIAWLTWGHLVWADDVTLAGFANAWTLPMLLVLSGVVTCLPMILFSYASRRVTLATLGLVNYVNPTLQFSIAALIFGEKLTIWHGIALALIWTALAIYSVEAFRLERSRSRKAINSVTDVAAPT